jgi:vacuolar protein sorting-associated protein 13A/C
VLNSMITKIIDNLQVALRNIHLRIENEDANDQDATFSIGITLQSVDLYTTDVNLKKTYVDRSLP